MPKELLQYMYSEACYKVDNRKEDFPELKEYSMHDLTQKSCSRFKQILPGGKMKQIIHITMGSAADNTDNLFDILGKKVSIKKLGVDFNVDLIRDLLKIIEVLLMP
jgi:hypothetical protein